MDFTKAITRQRSKLALQEETVAATQQEIRDIGKINKDGKYDAYMAELNTKLARQVGACNRTSNGLTALLELQPAADPAQVPIVLDYLGTRQPAATPQTPQSSTTRKR